MTLDPRAAIRLQNRLPYGRQFGTTMREDYGMITYYHTASYIYAVTNGYCSAVMDTAFATICEHNLGACPVDGAIAGNDLDTVIPIGEVVQRLDGTCRIRFKLGNVILLSDLITRVESVSSLSVPPSYRPKQSTIPEAPRSLRIPWIPRLPTIGRSDDDE
ncbi:MAG TPA: hypothetical protein VN397_01745 [Candidatus Methylomirabilis sp.]|nr:hypothetical protein [Candidatus Methylomirabilis sp.]